MKSAGVFFLLLAVSCVYASLDDDWEAFKNENVLQYDTEAEDQLRKARFGKMWSHVNGHNSKHKNDKSAARMHMHPMGLLSDEEFAQRKLGLKKGKITETVEVEAYPSLTALPASYDLRGTGYLSPVQNQKQCGSCWAFSAAGALEGAWFKKYGKIVNLSEQQLVDCGKLSDPASLLGCNGGWMNNAFNYIKNIGGLNTDAAYPYTSLGNGTCKYNSAKNGAKCSGYVNVAGDETSMMTALVNNGPLAIAIGVSSSSSLYKTGIFTSSMCVTPINHGVLLVGYGTDAGGNKYWIMKNSWGTSWGQAGYFFYPRNSATCVAQYPSYPLVP